MIDKLRKWAVMAVPGLSGSPCAVSNVSGKARSVAITSLMITSAMLRGPRHKSICAHIGSICTYVKRMNADGSRRRFGSGQILRNPFFVNRPVLAHTIFRGRFRQFFSRITKHFLLIIVVGFKIQSGLGAHSTHLPHLFGDLRHLGIARLAPRAWQWGSAFSRRTSDRIPSLHPPSF